MSLDRLRFRAWVKILITQENGEKFDFNLCLHDVDVISGGSLAGFDEGVLSDTLSETKLTDKQKEELWRFCNDNNVFDSETYYCIPIDKIEQCTGIQDKHGRLIYEGDVVKYKEIRVDRDVYFNAVVAWSKYFPTFICERENHNVCEVSKKLKVVGNIHENKGLLEDNAYGKPCGDNDKE